MKQQNELYPIFMKADKLNILIVGGGLVALEKLTYLLKSSPNAKVILVAEDILPEIKALVKSHDVHLIETSYDFQYLHQAQFIIAATNDKELNLKISKQAKLLALPINVADTPALCDFYLGSIVTKGNVKIAISTNGKSPTLAKRLREFFEYIIPDDINELALSLHLYRKQLKGDFDQKVQQLNSITKTLVESKRNN